MTSMELTILVSVLYVVGFLGWLVGVWVHRESTIRHEAATGNYDEQAEAYRKARYQLEAYLQAKKNEDAS